jgi:capsular polysaccharide export protein
LGSDLHAPASLVEDTTGIYFDPDAPSDLEDILQNAVFSPDELCRAQALTTQIVSTRVSKYNVDTASTLRVPDAGSEKNIILVPGQVEDDASIRRGCLDIRTNMTLLDEVRRENPSAFIIYKPHPDVVSGNRKGNFGFEREKQLCNLLVDDVSIASCLEKVDEVHTMTSLVGFEALLRGVRVTVYGRPFYAGFGLTKDRHKIERRTRKLTLNELVAGTLIRYPRYFSEAKDFFTTPENIVAELKENMKRMGHKNTTKTRWHTRQLRKLKHLKKGLFYVG